MEQEGRRSVKTWRRDSYFDCELKTKRPGGRNARSYLATRGFQRGERASTEDKGSIPRNLMRVCYTGGDALSSKKMSLFSERRKSGKAKVRAGFRKLA